MRPEEICFWPLCHTLGQFFKSYPRDMARILQNPSELVRKGRDRPKVALSGPKRVEICPNKLRKSPVMIYNTRYPRHWSERYDVKTFLKTFIIVIPKEEFPGVFFRCDTDFTKCNLTLAMSPTCHNNNALLICTHDFRVSRVRAKWQRDRWTDRQKAMHMSPPCTSTGVVNNNHSKVDVIP